MNPRKTLTDYLQILKTIGPDWYEYIVAVIDVEDTYDCEVMEFFCGSRRVGIPLSQSDHFWLTLSYLVHLAAHLWQQSEDETYPDQITELFYGFCSAYDRVCDDGSN